MLGMPEVAGDFKKSEWHAVYLIRIRRMIWRLAGANRIPGEGIAALRAQAAQSHCRLPAIAAC